MPEKSKVNCLNDLGLHAEALEAVERELAIREDKHTLWRAVTTALRNKRYALAAEYADRLKVAPGLKKKHIQIISLAYNFAGRSQEAYLCCREAVNRDETDSSLEHYSLACRGTAIGWNGEAFLNILIALPSTLHTDRYLMRKAFLDSELAAAWDYAATQEPDLEHAMTFYFPLWRSIVEGNQSLEPERCVDHTDLAHIPQEFHCLLRSSCPATFTSIPLTAATHPELHRRYLEWQAETAKPRIEAYARYMEKAEKILDDSQPLFAAFQAERHRFGAARTHLVRILRTSPDCDPARLPDIPLLAPLLMEFQVQYDESPEAFRDLVHRKHLGFTPEEADALPPINRRSGTTALLLGNGHYERNQPAQAIEAWSKCARIWPWDATPLLNLVKVLVETERTADASKALAAIRPEALSAELREKLERNIAEEYWIENIFAGPREIPLPEFGGFYPGADQEFLEPLRNDHTNPKALETINP